MDFDEMRGAMNRATAGDVVIHSDPDGRYVLWQADCRTVLSRMRDNSVDAIVTDPPYGLEFMGKDWDAPWKQSGTVLHDPSVVGGFQDGAGGNPFSRSRIRYGREGDAMVQFQAWFTEIATEALRVLKPGGHLLAFGGSRTYHRLACAVEDAGFEIRDQIQWVYASGFPKSLNVSKSDKVCQCEVKWVYGSGSQGTESETEHDVRFVSDGDLPQAIDDGSQRGEVLFSGVSEQGSSRNRRTRAESENAGREQPGVEGRGDTETTEGQLQGRQIRQVPRRVSANGKEGRLHHGASPSDGAHGGQISDTHGGGEPHKSQPVGQQAGELGTVSNERGSQTWRGWTICGGCGKPQIADGLGTALKPAHEPIVVARKPLEGTVAANVLKWGTGALNIDGTRVGDEGGTRKEPSPNKSQTSSVGGYLNAKAGTPINAGRWPANFIHDGSDEVLALFPDVKGQVGMRKTQGGHRFIVGDTESVQKFDHGTTDSGSAARFFYCAKAGKKERNAGLDGLPLGDRVVMASGGRTMKDGVWVETHSEPQKRQNHHPTVKPIALMRYLIRLVTPPGGVVLDPFAGSGTTMVAALLEGAQPWGCEMIEEYVPIILGRVQWALDEVDSRLKGTT